MEPAHHVVIIGGGFGGLYAANRLKRAGARVTLVDRRNFHLFQPLLYQVATGGLSPANIASPLRALVRRQRHANVVMGEVVDFDLEHRRLILREELETPLHYDSLIVATGSEFNYFGHDKWKAVAPGLKSLEDAIMIRRRVLSAFERAEVEFDSKRQSAQMTFVVVGGGPTGVELSGAIAELSRYTLRHEFRNINPADARIMLFEAGPTVLSMFPEDLRKKAQEQLEHMGVMVRTGIRVTDIRADGVTIQVGDQEENIPSDTVLWTAGVKASSLGTALAKAAGQEVDRAGRVTVEPDCTLPGHPEIFVIGDLANYSHQGGKPLPALAPVAMQQGRYVADTIMGRLRGDSPSKPFHYHDKGTLATIGRSAAVADIGWIKLSGFMAWLTWLFVHIMYLVQFQNRILVLIHWSFNYFTRGRAARLITTPPESPPHEP
ncbi:MAG: NAD(P)/FAD-dependent oxidoreductase [Planctomycetota bacterium]|nr:MAG: NAD(P)/FAD-dependent oxidoreductase [Planctomycetota bacterium]